MERLQLPHPTLVGRLASVQIAEMHFSTARTANAALLAVSILWAPAASGAVTSPMASLRIVDDEQVEMSVAVVRTEDGFRMSVDCVSNCPKPLHYDEVSGDWPLGLFQLWEGDDLVYAVGGGGVAYSVRAWSVTSKGVFKVLDASSRDRPEFLNAENGTQIVRTSEADGGTQPRRWVTWEYRDRGFHRASAR
jgi:hypothetical protein